MGTQGEGEERGKVVDARVLLAPMRSFVRSTLEAAEEDFVEILHFIENVVEGALRDDPKLVEYIRETGGETRLRAYRFLASLVRARKGADEFLDSLASDLAEVFRARK